MIVIQIVLQVLLIKEVILARKLFKERKGLGFRRNLSGLSGRFGLFPVVQRRLVADGGVAQSPTERLKLLMIGIFFDFLLIPHPVVYFLGSLLS